MVTEHDVKETREGDIGLMKSTSEGEATATGRGPTASSQTKVPFPTQGAVWRGIKIVIWGTKERDHVDIEGPQIMQVGNRESRFETEQKRLKG